MLKQLAIFKDSRFQREHLKQRLKPFLRFWRKVSNDWVFNLSGLLAYNILMSIFPMLLALLALSGFIIGAISPGSEQALVRAIANALPGGSSGTGGVVVHAVLHNLQRQAGAIFIIGLLTSIFTGSRLFITIENCFGVIFRLRGREVIRQNVVAIAMLLLYMALVPVLFLASFVPTAIVNAIQASGNSAVNSLLIHVIGLVAAFVVALVLFSAIYVVTPNRPVRISEVWKGTLLAAGLLTIYETLFPIYESVVLRPDNYGSVAAFAIVVLVFFYYLALILLLGAEVNSWASGQRETAGDIAAILHEIQAHNTTRGAAGPTAGSVREDQQHSKGAQAMATPERAEQHERDDHHVVIKTELDPAK
jgi:membrane protein